MSEFIKSVLIFVLLVTVMKGLINNESYRVYFKFFCGLILILLMLSPLINFLSGGNEWYGILEEEIFNAGIQNVNDELAIADGEFEELIREGCREDIKEQIVKMADKQNINIREIDIELNEESEEIQLSSVDISINADNTYISDNNDLQDNDTDDKSNIGDVDKVNIEAINIVSDNNSTDTGDKSRHKARGSNVKKLKSEISNYFLIKEAAVNIWE